MRRRRREIHHHHYYGNKPSLLGRLVVLRWIVRMCVSGVALYLAVHMLQRFAP